MSDSIFPYCNLEDVILGKKFHFHPQLRLLSGTVYLLHGVLTFGATGICQWSGEGASAGARPTRDSLHIPIHGSKPAEVLQCDPLKSWQGYSSGSEVSNPAGTWGTILRVLPPPTSWSGGGGYGGRWLSSLSFGWSWSSFCSGSWSSWYLRGVHGACSFTVCAYRLAYIMYTDPLLVVNASVVARLN